MPPSNEMYPGDYPDGSRGGGGEEEPFRHLEVHLVRQVSGFGFRIIGGKEEGSQVTIGGIVQGGAADVDGRLQVSHTHLQTQSHPLTKTRTINELFNTKNFLHVI